MIAKKFALAACVLGLPLLLAGCSSENQGYTETAATDGAQVIEAAGGTLNIIEFTPETAPGTTCINVSPRGTWTGTTQDCFPKAPASAATAESGVLAKYKIDSAGSTLLVTEFRPQSAPHMVCIHASPRGTWSGTTLNCVPR